MKTKGMERHAGQVSDYVKQSPEVKPLTWHLVRKHSCIQHNSLTVLSWCPFIGFCVLHRNRCFEYLLRFFSCPHILYLACSTLCNLPVHPIVYPVHFWHERERTWEFLELFSVCFYQVQVESTYRSYQETKFSPI